jgi:hypothetical protein
MRTYVEFAKSRIRSIGLVRGWLEGRPRCTSSAADARLRPGIRARVKPFARAFKKAHEVEIKPNRERRAQQPAVTAKKKHGNNGGNNGGNSGSRSGNNGGNSSNSSNSGGNNGAKDKRRGRTTTRQRKVPRRAKAVTTTVRIYRQRPG